MKVLYYFLLTMDLCRHPDSSLIEEWSNDHVVYCLMPRP